MGAAENAVQNACLEYLARVPGVLLVGRLNNNAVYDPKIQAYRAFGHYALLGLADIQALFKPGGLPAGGLLAVEAKTPEGGTSPEQQTYLAAVAASGNTAVLARSLADLVAVLERRAAPDPATGVYVPSGAWRLTASRARRQAPSYGGRRRWARR